MVQPRTIGFTLIELIVTLALMLVVLTAVSATFASGTHSETNASYGSRIIHLRDGWIVDE